MERIASGDPVRLLCLTMLGYTESVNIEVQQCLNSAQKGSGRAIVSCGVLRTYRLQSKQTVREKVKTRNAVRPITCLPWLAPSATKLHLEGLHPGCRAIRLPRFVFVLQLSYSCWMHIQKRRKTTTPVFEQPSIWENATSNTKKGQHSDSHSAHFVCLEVIIREQQYVRNTESLVTNIYIAQAEKSNRKKKMCSYCQLGSRSRPRWLCSGIFASRFHVQEEYGFVLSQYSQYGVQSTEPWMRCSKDCFIWVLM